MGKAGYLLVCGFLCGFLSGCGSTASPGAVVPLHVQGDAVITSVTLPLKFDDPEWSAKQAACRQGGYDLLPYAGQTLSLTKYGVLEKYYLGAPIAIKTVDGSGLITTETISDGHPLDLWTIFKDDSPVCSYVTGDSIVFEELIREGFFRSDVFAVNDSHIR